MKGSLSSVHNFYITALSASLQDLSVAARVNGTFRALSSDEGLWRSL